jgi:AcrR family transcriptional regulator
MSEARSVRGPYRNGIERRQQIVEKAAEIFATYGFIGGSLRQIALEVGVTPAALSRHFDSKEDLLTGVVEYWRERTERVTDPEARGLDFFEQLRKIVSYHVEHPGYLELFLTLSTEATDPRHPAASFIRDRYARTLEAFCEELKRAVDAGAARQMTSDEIEFECRAMIAFMDGIELQWLLDDTVDLQTSFDRYLAACYLRWGAETPSRTA